jgi:hypothetical protein
MSTLKGKRKRTRRGMRSLTVVGLPAVLGLATGTRAQGEENPPDWVPKAVMASAKAKFPGAEIKVTSEQTDDGKPPVYALEMKDHRHDVYATFKADGTAVLVETAVPAKELPRSLLRAVEHQYPDARVRGADSVTTGPEVKRKADSYECYLMTANWKPARVQVDPHGKLRKPGGTRRR